MATEHYYIIRGLSFCCEVKVRNEFPKVQVRDCFIFVLLNNIGIITESALRMCIYNICCVSASNYMVICAM